MVDDTVTKQTDQTIHDLAFSNGTEFIFGLETIQNNFSSTIFKIN